MTPGSGRCMVVVADDFGMSISVNRAITEAHRKGIVTAASLMAGGEAFEDAVRTAESNRELSVGLHITLCDGNAVLSNSDVPDLVDRNGHFRESPSLSWILYSRAALFAQVIKEIEAQFDRVERAGIQPTHVDSHHHIHMHPAVFAEVCRQASRRGIRWIRIPREPFRMMQLIQGGSPLPLVEWVVFRMLGAFHEKYARRFGLQISRNVYGLSRTGHVDEEYLLKILEFAARGPLPVSVGAFKQSCDVIEIFSHPDSKPGIGRRELKALTSDAVCARIASLGIQLSGYRELSTATAA